MLLPVSSLLFHRPGIVVLLQSVYTDGHPFGSDLLRNVPIEVSGDRLEGQYIESEYTLPSGEDKSF